ncbi:MAG: NAD(P)-dependent oxidoreductase [Alkalispirochaeta sp.]
MNITVLEPLGLTTPDLDATLAPLRAAGHHITIYQDRPSSPTETIARIGDAEVVVIANMPFPGEVVRAAKNLKFLAVAFTGVNHVDIDACTERGVAVSNAAGFSTESVAELTVGMIIGMLRNVVPGDAAVRAGGTNAGLFGRELNGMTVGIVGTGEIGRRVATVLSVFGVRLLGFNRTRYPQMEALGMQYLELDELLAASDVVSVHVALTPETTGLLSAERVAGMKPGAYLVNVARGKVVDSAAVAAALESGQLAGAAIDVFETEPPIAKDHPFLKAPNTLLLPHVAFGTHESFQKRAEIVLDNIESWLDGAQKRVIV